MMEGVLRLGTFEPPIEWKLRIDGILDSAKGEASSPPLLGLDLEISASVTSE